ncbi:hypothetical protein FB45DRAFT_931780 [Roridomyces roridus]|uniref:Uncharacterized protein n=1 Tax=Roridomyces roridus TaxID=1738132 RepID=A0AAD7BE85_9AGAR|nr:hypothetical protein FB45DRAFT_931780 [Roridomyces roridus]
MIIRSGGDSVAKSPLVVDDLHLRAIAGDSTSAGISCEEIYFSKKEKWLYIFHSSQTAFYSSQPRIDTPVKRKLYWEYIALHPSHTFVSLANWLPEAHKLAEVYLQWCTFEALTSSGAKIPFPLKHSQDLSRILASLDEQPEDDAPVEDCGENPEVPAEEEIQPVGPVELSVEPAPSIRVGSDHSSVSEGDETRPMLPERLPDPIAETAAQESCKLRTALVAKVLSKKYNQQGAVDGSKDAGQPPKPSKVLDLLFWTVDITSFGSFFRYLSRLEDVRAPILTNDEWRDHIMRLVKEWEEFNLISTVLLSASAGILALQDIGSIARTAVLVSIICSFGSITTGLYCISMYQIRAPDPQDSLDRANSRTILAYNHYTLTHKRFALILGLPMAFLVWSLISFMVGILSFNIVGTETRSGHVSGVAYAVVAVAGLVFILMGAAFYTLVRVWGTGHGVLLFQSIKKRIPTFSLRFLRPKRRGSLPESEKAPTP